MRNQVKYLLRNEDIPYLVKTPVKSAINIQKMETEKYQFMRKNTQNKACNFLENLFPQFLHTIDATHFCEFEIMQTWQ